MILKGMPRGSRRLTLVNAWERSACHEDASRQTTAVGAPRLVPLADAPGTYVLEP
jgi:hypothetical protein